VIRRKRPYAWWHIIVLCWCFPVALLAGCSSVQSPATSGTAAADEAPVIKTIAVIPFRNIIPEDPSVGYVKCPLSGAYFLSSVPCSGTPEETIEAALVKKMEKYRNITLVEPGRVRGAYLMARSDSLTAEPYNIILKVGVDLGVDAVLAGYIYRYRERRGYAYAVEQPASVAFGIYLLRVKDGAMVWKGVFDKTQSSLMENILDVKTFIKGHGTWLTAKQLAEAGIDQILTTFPGESE
jgi:hypothetical protein